MSAGPVMAFQLYGGPADGAVVRFALAGAGEIYLVRMPREDDTDVHDVLAYEFANRADASGKWVLDYVRWVGFQGMGKVPREESAE